MGGQNWFKKTAQALCITGALALAACTQVIPGAERAGFENVASEDGAQIYVCDTGSCGNLLIAVHKTEGVTAQEVAELDRFASSDFGRRLLREALASEASSRGETGFGIGTVRRTTLGGRDSISASISARASDGQPLRGHLIVVIDGSSAEIFVTLSESSRRARNEAFRLARLWAASA